MLFIKLPMISSIITHLSYKIKLNFIRGGIVIVWQNIEEERGGELLDFNWFKITDEIFIYNYIDIVDILNCQWNYYWFFHFFSIRSQFALGITDEKYFIKNH